MKTEFEIKEDERLSKLSDVEWLDEIGDFLDLIDSDEYKEAEKFNF